jgi:hypothetical protein
MGSNNHYIKYLLNISKLLTIMGNCGHVVRIRAAAERFAPQPQYPELYNGKGDMVKIIK